MINMRHWVLGVLIALGILGCTTAISYLTLNHIYGAARIYFPSSGYLGQENIDNISPQSKFLWERAANVDVSISPTYQVALPGLTLYYDVTITNIGENEITYTLTALDNAGWSPRISPNSLDVRAGEHKFAKLVVDVPENFPYGARNVITVLAASRYAQAGASDTAVAYSVGAPSPGAESVIVYERPIAVLPIAASIGVAMGFVVFAVWVGYRRMWGDATSELLERGLHDMTVRDVEIVGQIMNLGEFTIPELMKRTRASKITVWRTVQKLVEQGLVQPTEKTRLAANGLGGRGKPSHVYKYGGKIAAKGQTEGGS